MSERRVVFELTEIQKLKLKLAQRDCELNIARRCEMDAEQRFYQLAANTADAGLKAIEGELSKLEQENEQLVRRFVDVGEWIKTQNNWPRTVTWDAVTLEFSAPVAPGEGPKSLVH